MPDTTAIIIGAGPAGLTAGYLLAKASQRVVVLESDATYVGGLSRTAEHHGYRFDIGGHRFFSKSAEIEALWTELLGDDLLERPRLSRIYYNHKFLAYPMRAGEVLTKLGPIEAMLSVLSYLKARLFPVPNPRSFEDWVTNQFGARLYRAFFKTYTEKVWGMSCRDISADWAAQRISGLSLGSAIRQALMPSKQKPASSDTIKTLVTSFRYPRLGPGMMWERCRDRIVEMGGEVLLGHRVTECRYLGGNAGWEVITRAASGEERRFTAPHVISSAPIRELARMIEPALPARVTASTDALKYRDFITIALIMPDRLGLSDNWIYVHDPSVRVGRIQNFKSWSPELVPDPSMCCYGLEYFCFEGDGLWTSSDEELIALATRELAQLGLAQVGDVQDACVVRQPKAYPVYDADYSRHVATLRTELAEHFPGLHLVGRNGMHKYNNQDHAMMTAMLTARNIVAGEPLYDPWRVNQDAEYHESGSADSEIGGRAVPRAIATGTQR
ncbi:MAG: NAD(P)/FAD-dependent oxidoreductase [Gemmatimonadaceae bacterium]